MNKAHNNNSVISYYPLPNNMDPLARLQKCTLFSSLDLRSGYHHISLTPEANPNTAFLPQHVVNGTGTWPLSVYAHFKVFSAF